MAKFGFHIELTPHVWHLGTRDFHCFHLFNTPGVVVLADLSEFTMHLLIMGELKILVT